MKTNHAIVVLIGSLAFLAGCQVHPVRLKSNNRTVTLDDVRNTQRVARARLSRVSARLEVEEWIYTPEIARQRSADSQPASAPESEGGEPRVPDRVTLRTWDNSDPPMTGSRVRHVWDAGHRHRVTHLVPDERTPWVEGIAPSYLQVTDAGDQLLASFDVTTSPTERRINQITLTRLSNNGQHTAADHLLLQGLENDAYFSASKHWGGQMEAVQEDGLDLVKVTWSAMGTDVIEWFRPDQGFRLHRRESRDFQKKVHARTIASDYRMVNGFPYPFHYEVTMWDDWDAKRITQKTRCEVHSAEFNVPVSPDEFMIDAPAGTRIVLEDMKPGLFVPGFRPAFRTRVLDRPLRGDVQAFFDYMNSPETPPASAPAAETAER